MRKGRRLTEANLGAKVQEMLDSIDVKDWYRAATVDYNRIGAMLKAIKDPKKYVGRVLALFFLGRISIVDVEKYFKDVDEYKDYLTTQGMYNGRYGAALKQMPKVWNDPGRFDSDEAEYEFYKDEWQDFDLEAFLASPEGACNVINDITREELLECDTLIVAMDKYPEVAKLAQKFKYTKASFEKDLNYHKDSYNSTRDRVIASYNAKSAFGGKRVFEYVLDYKEVQQKLKYDPEDDELVQRALKSSDLDFYSDSDRIIPPPLMKFLSFKTNFAEWLKQNYDIDVSVPQYWNSYNRENEFEYLNDDSAWNAGALRKDPIFQNLLKVTRTGISFTRPGALKYWYDCATSFAEQQGYECNLKEKF